MKDASPSSDSDTDTGSDGKTDAGSLPGSSCPIPITRHEEILLGHGSGGKLTQQLIDEILLPAFGNPYLNPLHDGAVLDLENFGPGRIAMSTDSYVVNPIFFPGGDIGALAVHGTINDLAMCGATPRFLSVGFILEEGLSVGDLKTVVASMQRAASEAGVSIVTGDTKVVDRGKGDSIFINTTGIGTIPDGVSIDPKRAAAGDKIVISGEIASHGMAIMCARDGLEFESRIQSDSAALHDLVARILEACPDVHVLRDPTRGGVTSALNEIAAKAGVGIAIEEDRIPIDPQVAGACEILGLDPLHVANEGKLIAIVPAGNADSVVSAMRANPLGKKASIIGEVVGDHPGFVTMKTRVGGTRVVTMLSGEQLPRIC